MQKTTSPSSPLVYASLLSIVLSVVKAATFVATGSLVVLSSFFDSLADSAVSYINSRVYKWARQRPDKEHPFGHGGIEVISSISQGLLIATFGIILAVQSLDRLLTTTTHTPLKEGNLLGGSIILLFSAFGGLLLQWYLTKAEKKLEENNERSLSITADKGHYQADFWANLISAISLGIVWYTKLPILDGAFALIASALLMKVSYSILKKSLKDVLHQEVDPELQKKIFETVMASDARIKGIHMLRSRQLGPTLFIDFHLVLPSATLVAESYTLVNKTIKELNKKFPSVDVVIHVDPDNIPEESPWKPEYTNQ